MGLGLGAAICGAKGAERREGRRGQGREGKVR